MRGEVPLRWARAIPRDPFPCCVRRGLYTRVATGGGEAVADVTVFVDAAVLGTLPPVCVKDVTPTLDHLTIDTEVAGGTGLGVALAADRVRAPGLVGTPPHCASPPAVRPPHRQSAVLLARVPDLPGGAPHVSRLAGRRDRWSRPCIGGIQDGASPARSQASPCPLRACSPGHECPRGAPRHLGHGERRARRQPPVGESLPSGMAWLPPGPLPGALSTGRSGPRESMAKSAPGASPGESRDGSRRSRSQHRRRARCSGR